MDRRIHYRRVEWFGGVVEDLVARLQAVLAVRPNVDQARFVAAGQTFEVRHRDFSHAGEARLHMASFVQGARRPINTTAAGVPSADLGEAPPPANSEFTETEIAVVARATGVAFVATGIHGESRLKQSLRQLLALGHGQGLANRLVLSARADAAMITRLLQEGVDTLDLRLSLSAPEADEVVEQQPRALGDALGVAIGQAISTRATLDHEPEDIDMLSDMNARLLLKLRKRKPTVEQVANLTALAQEAIDDGDEQFTIRTLETKTEFTRDKLMLSGTFQQPHSARLDYQGAWDAASEFLENQVWGWR